MSLSKLLRLIYYTHLLAMKALFYIFLGGGFGSVTRYLLSSFLNPLSQFMPYGTLLSNILACFVLGIGTYLFNLKFPNQEFWRLAILIGFCGGFSTFSTFSNEVLGFLRDQNYTSMAIYTGISLVCCNLAIGLGLVAAKSWWG